MVCSEENSDYLAVAMCGYILQDCVDVAGTTNLVEGRASVGWSYLCYVCAADWSIPVRLLFRVLLAGSCCAAALCGLK